MNVDTTIFLRSAVLNDMQMLYDWANSDLVRNVSVNNKKFSWEKHQSWFEKYLTDSSVKILIAVDSADSPLGQIRFNQIDELNAEVDVHTRPDLTGLGIGTKIIRQGTENYFKTSKVLFIHALVLKSNIASIKAFQKANYHYQSEVSIDNKNLIKLTRNRGQ